MKVAIIGNGIAGITAARYIRKQSDYDITVISSESKHFFSRTALMYIYMGHMKYENTKPYEDYFWEKNRITLIQEKVEKINFDTQSLTLSSNSPLKYDKLIIATGSTSRFADWPGYNLKGVQGLYSLQDLEQMEENSNGIKQAVISGGGLIGIEMAEMLHSRNIHITYLVREDGFFRKALPKEESVMVDQHILAQGVDLRLNSEISEIIADDRMAVRAVRNKAGSEIPCQFVGVTIGVQPNLSLVRNSIVETNKGILINEYLETNVPNVYAIGDCAEIREPMAGRHPVEAVWYAGKMMGKCVANNICGNQAPYSPGIWYNSAKFFDIEWQTYGYVPTRDDPGFDSLFWQHPKQNKSIRLVYDKNTKIICGFNLMGIRYRHKVCEKWIQEKRPIAYVVQHLDQANFDPEFSKRYEKQLVEIYNSQFPEIKISLFKKGIFSNIFN